MSRAESRGQARFLLQLDLVLQDAKGATLDLHGQAQDISPSGFRIETRAELKKGQDVQFELILEDGYRLRGGARVLWVQPDGRGWCSAGARITKLSWSDRGRLRRQVTEEGYDFVGLARNLFWTAYWVVVAVALHNILHHQPVTRLLIWRLAPIAGALMVAGWAMLELLG